VTDQEVIDNRIAQVNRDCVAACLASTFPFHEARMWRMCGALSDAGLMYLAQELSRRQLFDDEYPRPVDFDEQRPMLLQDEDDVGIDYCVPRSCR
jgi:hypothetical protein